MAFSLKGILSKGKNLLKNKKILAATIVGVLVVGFIAYSATQKAPVEFSSTAAERKTLVQSVEETGTVEASTDLSYGWEVSGRVATIQKKVGDTVEIGDLIATLNSGTESARLSEGYAQLASANAVLQRELAGASDEERAEAGARLDRVKADRESVRIAGENSVASAEKALEDAEVALENNATTSEQDLKDAYDNGIIDANDAYTGALNSLITIAELQNRYTTLQNEHPYATNLENAMIHAVRSMLGAVTDGTQRPEILLTYSGGLRERVRSLSSATPKETIESTLSELVSGIELVRRASDIALDGLYAAEDATNADKTSLNTARTNLDGASATASGSYQQIVSARLALGTSEKTKTIAVQTARITLDNAKRKAAEDLASADASVKEAQSAYDKLLAPPRAVDLASIRADVARAQANVAALQNSFAKTQLKALAAGVISRIDVSVGETVTGNEEVLGLVSTDLNVTLDVSETDITKVSVGDTAEITLDAFGDTKKFTGTVVDMDPAQTEISGVVYYETRIQLALPENNEEGVRPGMTANVKIITETKENVVVVPGRAILSHDDGTKFVRVVTNKEKGVFEERAVTAGLSGEEGLVEITSGVEEGQEVVTFLKEV